MDHGQGRRAVNGGAGTRRRAALIVEALTGELLLPPVRSSLGDLAAGLERLALVDATVGTRADVRTVQQVADAVCDGPQDCDPVRVLWPVGWAGPVIAGGPLGPIPATPSTVAFGARCDADWLSRYCSARGGSWGSLGVLAGELEELLAELAETLRSADDARAEEDDERDLDPTAAAEAAQHHEQVATRLARLRAAPLTTLDVASGCGIEPRREHTLDVLRLLRTRLDTAARIMAQVGTVKVGTIRTLAYAEADQLVVDGALADLWSDLRGSEPLPAQRVGAEATVIAALRDGAVEVLCMAAARMGIVVVSTD